MHHQGRVQSHRITPSAQGCTVSPNYMKLQSSEWFLPSGRQLGQQYLGHRGTEKAKQHCLVSVRINTAPPVPHPLHSKCHSKHVTDLPQKSSLSCCVGREFFAKFLHRRWQAIKQSHRTTCVYIIRAEQEVEFPKRRSSESGYRAYLLQQSCQGRELSMGPDVIYLCLSAWN